LSAKPNNELVSAQELIIWSMALGAIAAVAMARFADLVARPSLSQVQGVAYHVVVFLFVLLECGLASQVSTPNPRLVQPAQVLAGPICVGLSNFWIRGWLSAAQRDRVMSGVLRGSALLLPIAGLACLALPKGQQLPAAAALSLLGAVVTAWLSTRAWLLGDRLAPVMATGCLLTLPAIAGLYAVAMNLNMSVAITAFLALCTVLCNGFTGFALWQRDRHEWKNWRNDAVASQFDPVTKLHSGVSLVQKLIKAQKRRRHIRREGAVIAVMVFDVELLQKQLGTAAVNEVFIALANRMQRQVGVVNPVGRYWDRCFVSLVETIHSPAWLRTLGLRVSTNLQRPISVTGLNSQKYDVRADIGVGVVHIASQHEAVEDILHDAQRLAEAAREMRSRAAILDPASGEVVPVEQANLGPKRHGHAGKMPHA
jgi:GGDEF domain-containing protein